MTWKGWETFDARAIRQAGAAAKPRKYRNQVTEVDGLTFDSKREAARYQVLKLRMHAGEINGLELQPRFPIWAIGPLKTDNGPMEFGPAFTMTQVGHYTADFAYIDLKTGERVIEDVKSRATATEAYRLRKRHVEAQYGVTIREI